MKCEDCKFFFNPECRRYPPTSNGFGIANPDVWCGEFKEIVKEIKSEDPVKAFRAKYPKKYA